MKLLGIIVVFLYILHAGAGTIKTIVKQAETQDTEVKQLGMSFEYKAFQ